VFYINRKNDFSNFQVRIFPLNVVSFPISGHILESLGTREQTWRYCG